jgi:hypothetical protein
MQVLRNFRRTQLKMVEVELLEERDKEEMKELKKFIDDENASSGTAANPTPVQSETIGRQTGTAQWKAARGEDGAKS